MHGEAVLHFGRRSGGPIQRNALVIGTTKELIAAIWDE
jgi:hypothetical protein